MGRGAPPTPVGTGRTLVRGASARGLAFLAGNALAALAAVVLLRHLGVADFGRYGTVIALVAIVQGVSDVGLSVTAMRELALIDDAAERRMLLADVVGARLLLTAAGVALAVGFAVVARYGGALVLGTCIAGLGVVLTSTQAALVLPLSVQLRNELIAVNELVRQGVVALVLVVLAAASAPLGAFFLAQLAAGVVGLALVPVLLGGRSAVVRPRFTPAALRTVVRRSAPVGVASVLSVVYFRILAIIVGLLTGPEQTGLYLTAARVFELAIGLPLLLSVVAVPLLTVAARDDQARLQLVLQRMTETMAVAGVAAALGLAAGARPVLHVLGGDEYLGAAPALRILAVALITIFLGAAWTPSLVGLGRLGDVARASAAGLVAVVVLGIALTEAFGIEGAAVAVVVADVVTIGGTFAALRRAGPGRSVELRFLPRLVAATLPAIAIAAAPGLPDAVAAALAVGVFLALALVQGLVPREILDAARR